jgi:amino-acid N-acetyltransferase
MRISSSPTMEQVSRLLGQCGLPSGDILPEDLPNFVLARYEDVDAGVAGLQVFGSVGLVRSVAVVPTRRSRGLGATLLAAIERRARSQGVTQLFLLTNDAQGFFIAHGYRECPRCSAPAEIQGCSQFDSSSCRTATLMTKQVET